MRLLSVVVLEPTLSTRAIAAALGVSMDTVQAWRTERWRILHPAQPPFPAPVERGRYKPSEVAAWVRGCTEHEPPGEWG